jgi:tRNA A-37 threonylcarbamoyl transferase component Bud32
MGVVTMNGVLADAIRQAKLDTLEGAMAYSGGESLEKPGLGSRQRTRVEVTDSRQRPQTFYLKRYGPSGLWSTFRGWLQTGKWASPAGREAENIRRCRAADVKTMEVLAWDQKGPAGESYIVVTSVPGDALERIGQWLVEERPSLLPQMTDRLAEMARRLHEAGLFHRDFYASHVFCAESENDVELHLIDLARLTRPLLRRRRWRVKDLAQIKYSMPETWVTQFWPRFLAGYCGAAGGAADLNARVEAKVSRMQKRNAGRPTERAE